VEFQHGSSEKGPKQFSEPRMYPGKITLFTFNLPLKYKICVVFIWQSILNLFSIPHIKVVRAGISNKCHFMFFNVNIFVHLPESE